MPFHSGESKMHQLLHVPPMQDPTSLGLTRGAAYMLSQAPLLAFGILDDQGRPWTSLWGGSRGFSSVIGQDKVEIQMSMDGSHDPVIGILSAGYKVGNQIVEPTHDAQVASALSIDLETRSRVKLFGAVVAEFPKSADSRMRMTMRVKKSLGNCPKYLNIKHIDPAISKPTLLAYHLPLSPEALGLLSKADLFFLSSSNKTLDMDTNHRGGPPGFVRVISNNSHNASIVWPEYSGNRLYQTLGNLQESPLAGLVFPDFASGDVLYLTGTTDIIFGDDATDILPGSNLAVRLHITIARYVKNGLTFRGITGEASPYNPPVRLLRKERPSSFQRERDKVVTAMLIKKEILTPSIVRYRFRIITPQLSQKWRAGQYVALDLNKEVSAGYSHMRDDDPKSLNDDFIRTFTISSPAGNGDEFEMTIRKVGVVTEFLFRQEPHLRLEVPLRGFGGSFFVQQKEGEFSSVVAGGIGITPLLAQLPTLDLCRIRLFWALRVDDVNLVSDTFIRCPQLAKSTSVFVTGSTSSISGAQQGQMERICEAGAKLETRRISKKDLQTWSIEASKWYLCAGPALMTTVMGWLDGKEVVTEEFSY